tara:strand:+ start:233 stop:382 length:150 start_codon:yes stop_codon:yes gene_type:complete
MSKGIIISNLVFSILTFMMVMAIIVTAIVVKKKFDKQNKHMEELDLGPL